MPYIGYSPTNAGSFIQIDDFSSSFNGITTAFTMQIGSVDITPNLNNLLVTLDGVLQHEDDAYTISGSTINFDSAPPSGASAYIILMGQSASVGQGTIGADELNVSGDGTSGQALISDGDGTFSWSTDAEPYLELAGGTMSGDINLASNAIINGGAIAGTFTGGLTGAVTGNADTATALATARTIGGTSFDGTANIAVALASTATTLATARSINGVSFNGSSAITVTADANTLSNTTLKSTVVSSSLTSVGTLTNFRSTGIDDNASTLAVTVHSTGQIETACTADAVFAPRSTHANGAYISMYGPSSQIGYIGSAKALISSSYATNDMTLRSEANLYLTAGGSGADVKIEANGDTTVAGSIISSGGSAGDNTLYKHSNNYLYLLGGTTGLILKGKNSDDSFTIMSNSEQRVYHYTNNTERMVIHNGGTTIQTGLAVNGNVSFNVAGDNLGLVMKPTGSGSTTLRLDTYADDDAGRNWAFRNRYNAHGRLELHRSTTNTAEPLTVTQQWDNDGTSTFKGDVTVEGDVKMANGRGISFTNTSNEGGMTSELLDDYEEGTWTATARNSVTLIGSNNLCSYTKIGQIVHCGGQVQVDNDNSDSAMIIELPFTSHANFGEGANYWTGAVRLYGVPFPTGVESPLVYTNPGNNFLEIAGSIPDAGAESIKAQTSGYYMFQITYIAE